MKPVRPKTPRKPLAKLKSTVKDPIEVYCRIRPLDNEYDQVCVRAKDEKTVVLFPPDVSQTSRTFKEVHYSFQQVFNEKT
ncbi:Kinesin-like protein KIF23, partial [Stegodyphus mimosarum]